VESINTDEKREQVREFIEDTPDPPGPGARFSPVVPGDSERYSAGGCGPSGVAPRPAILPADSRILGGLLQPARTR
jgi:hypothetical protein